MSSSQVLYVHDHLSLKKLVNISGPIKRAMLSTFFPGNQCTYITTYFGALFSASKVASKPLNDKAIYTIIY